MRKTLVSCLLGLSVLTVPMSLQAKATEPTECPSGTFKCYCNGSFVGCVTTVQYCWNACTASQIGLDPASAPGVSKPTSLTETSELEQFLVSISE